MKFFKKTVCAIIAVCAAVIPFIEMPDAVYASGASETSHSWYVVRNKNHTLPKTEKTMDFLSKHNAYYGDTKAAESGEKVIYLTFDAGYENGNIKRILDTLKKHGAPGAFFVLENLVKREPELIKRMASEGHLVCNHTSSHPDMSKFTDIGKFREQLDSMKALTRDVCGVEMANYYRPPEGRFSEKNLEFASSLGYKTVFWSFAYADWDNNRQPSEAEAIKKITDNVHPGEIMLLHPTSKTNADILDKVLTMLEADGYRFASLDELK